MYNELLESGYTNKREDISDAPSVDGNQIVRTKEDGLFHCSLKKFIQKKY